MKQLLIFFGLAYSISWLIWLPLYGHIFGITSLPTLPYHHGLGGLGPLIAAFITTRIYNKSEGLKQLFRKCLQVKPLLYLCIALFSPFLLAIIASGIQYLVKETPINFSGILTCREFPHFNFLTFFMYNLIFFGFGEEVGWRGFALPRLRHHFKDLPSTLILTVFWAIWHWPLFFYRQGYVSMDIAAVSGWIFSLLTGSVLLTWLYNSSRSSILICAVFHTSIDIAFTSEMADASIVNNMGILITLWGILTLILYKPKARELRRR